MARLSKCLSLECFVWGCPRPLKYKLCDRFSQLVGYYCKECGEERFEILKREEADDKVVGRT